MTDVLGWRRVFGVIAPSTNTVVEADFNRMAPDGVTPHMARIHIRDPDMSNNAHFEDLIRQIRLEITAACERVLTCEPDHMVMGMSAETFWGGLAQSEAFTRSIERLTGLGVTTGAAACNRALKLLDARRIAVVTPYQPVADENVRQFFTESGFDVLQVKGLCCPTAVSIARVSEAELRAALLEVDRSDADAIVQCGTNLSMVRLADEAERWLKKPVLAINAATWWAALRDNGLADRVDGAGSLLRDA
ncbi:MAG: maleate cis-trans isomerase family protein [Solirubrobacteraceae bacterium]